MNTFFLFLFLANTATYVRDDPVAERALPPPASTSATYLRDDPVAGRALPPPASAPTRAPTPARPPIHQQVERPVPPPASTSAPVQVYRVPTPARLPVHQQLPPRTPAGDVLQVERPLPPPPTSMPMVVYHAPTAVPYQQSSRSRTPVVVPLQQQQLAVPPQDIVYVPVEQQQQLVYSGRPTARTPQAASTPAPYTPRSPQTAVGERSITPLHSALNRAQETLNTPSFSSSPINMTMPSSLQEPSTSFVTAVLNDPPQQPPSWPE